VLLCACESIFTALRGSADSSALDSNAFDDFNTFDCGPLDTDGFDSADSNSDQPESQDGRRKRD
jgi:hypothetical protein